MQKSYKTELAVSLEQADRIRQTIGVCRLVYNMFVGENTRRHRNGEPFLSGYDFSKYLNNEYLPSHSDKTFIKSVSSKAIKHAIMDADKAYRRFFAGKSRHPRFKKKGRNDPGMYFVNGNLNTRSPLVQVDRHRIKIPTLGWVKLKEKGYLPVKTRIISGTVTMRAGRFFVSVVVDEPNVEPSILSPDGIGVDLGIKNFMTVSDGRVYPNINKTQTVRRLRKKLKREQRRLSRKQEDYKRRNKSLKGEATRQNIRKSISRIQRLYYRLDCIQHDYQDKCVSELVKAKPAHITIEDLNVNGMMKNRHLADSIASQQFYRFRQRLVWKARMHGIEVRVVDRWHPSSKTCHQCGHVRTDLKLNDRTYHCPACGLVIDRDMNAAMNLKAAVDYIVV